MKIWVYTSRKGEVALFPGTTKGFAGARFLQDSDNRCTVEQAAEYGEVGGSEEEGHFYVDDGGSIDLKELR